MNIESYRRELLERWRATAKPTFAEAHGAEHYSAPAFARQAECECVWPRAVIALLALVSIVAVSAAIILATRAPEEPSPTNAVAIGKTTIVR